MLLYSVHIHSVGHVHFKKLKSLLKADQEKTKDSPLLNFAEMLLLSSVDGVSFLPQVVCPSSHAIWADDVLAFQPISYMFRGIC